MSYEVKKATHKTGAVKNPSGWNFNKIFEYLVRIPHYTIVITINIRLYCLYSFLRVKVVFNESRGLDRPEFTCVTIDHTATSLEEHQRTPKPPFFILKLIKIKNN